VCEFELRYAIRNSRELTQCWLHVDLLEVIAGALQPETLALVKNRLNEIEKRNQTGPESPMQETLAVLLLIAQTALDRQSAGHLDLEIGGHD
jgi:hypothetical protein